MTPNFSDGDGWVTYEIDVSAELASSGEDVPHLVFFNDDAGGNGVSTFRNVTIEE